MRSCVKRAVILSLFLAVNRRWQNVILSEQSEVEELSKDQFRR